MSRYEINVAFGGEHYCRIHLPETHEVHAKHKAREITRLFGAGFKVTMTCWYESGVGVKLD